jgi:hypothetical protein
MGGKTTRPGLKQLLGECDARDRFSLLGQQRIRVMRARGVSVETACFGDSVGRRGVYRVKREERGGMSGFFVGRCMHDRPEGWMG